MDQALVTAAKLVADPCNGPLTSTIGPDPSTPVLVRNRTTRTLDPNPALPDGYAIWFPSFTNRGKYNEIYSPSNVYLHQTGAPATRPINSAITPMGTVGLTNTGIFLPDPAYYVTSGTSSTFSRSKAMAACIQLEYTGALQSIGGQVAVISNFSLAAFDMNRGAPATWIQPPSVDEVFAYASERHRISLDGHEVVWRPRATTSVLRSNGDAGTGTPDINMGPKSDTCFWNGSTTVVAPATSAMPTTVVPPNPSEIYGICIAWRGINTNTTGGMILNFVKVSAMELGNISGMLEPSYIPRPISTTWSDTVDKVCAYLDNVAPGWQRRAIHMASTTAVSGLARVMAPNVRMGITGRSLRALTNG